MIPTTKPTPARAPTPLPASPLLARLTAAGEFVDCSVTLAQVLDSTPAAITGTSIFTYLSPRLAGFLREGLPLRPPDRGRYLAASVHPAERPHEATPMVWWIEPVVERSTGVTYLHVTGYTPPFPDIRTRPREIMVATSDAVFPQLRLAPQWEFEFADAPNIAQEMEVLLAEHATISLFVQQSPSSDIYMSPAGFELLGITPEDAVHPNFSMLDFIHPEDLAATRALDAAYHPVGEVVTSEFRVITAQGSVRHIRQFTMRSSEDARYVGLCVDVTSEKIQHRTMRVLIKSMESAIVSTTEDDLLMSLMSHLTVSGGYRYAAIYQAARIAEGDIAGGRVTRSGRRIYHDSGDNRWLDHDVDTYLNDVITHKKPIFLPEEAHSPGEPAAAFLPVFLNEDVDLVLAVWAEEASAFMGDNNALLEELVEQLGWALGKLAVSRTVALATQTLHATLDKPDVSFTELKSASENLLATIGAAGASRYWNRYNRWEADRPWTAPPAADTPST